MVLRVYVEKRCGFDIEAKHLQQELCDILQVKSLSGLRIINRYDVEGISDELFKTCATSVFSEPQIDEVFFELPELSGAQQNTTHMFAVEYLPGQFDMRADSASECIQLISQGARPLVRSAKIYILNGALSDVEIDAIKKYIINPIESREASFEPFETLQMEYVQPDDVEILEGFCELDKDGLQAFINERGLAMDLADIKFFQQYFKKEGREPSITEVKVVDTYWSDHCRHTTFGTVLEDISIEDERVQRAFERYKRVRHELGRDKKPICLMDLGTIGAKYLKHKGILTNLDESEEINACTVKVKVDVDGKDEDWLYLFKNETHNHPTEVEPFGGAATCVGGAIRDPLSGRSYVYQSMRLTGAANPLQAILQTLPGKLPQRKLVTTAAAGFSSYGNQIGLATGQVNELYHPGYAAKRMEIGAVVGATPASHVRRETPKAGDVIVLLGGRTGRDGIGGATGSSKAHTSSSLETCGAEVQKGNAPIERKLQRLFRRGEACRLIKRCNDFGAGGVSVATGELAEGLEINLDAVPKKYEGLDGTELAIAESQERMACVLAASDLDEFLTYAVEENLEATKIAVVTKQARLRMNWRGKTIVDLSREFLDSNGAPKYAKVHVPKQSKYDTQQQGEYAMQQQGEYDAQQQDEYAAQQQDKTFAERMKALLADLNVCSNKGLGQRFDSTIGAATVLMPFGGKKQLTPSMAMVAKMPVCGETYTCSGMSWGFDPYFSEKDQYKGAYMAVLESLSKLVAAGFKRQDAYLTFQEYYGKLRSDPKRWGKPFTALLGALDAQLDLEVASIGGKDSMSGSFEDMDVPPTLVSFATAIGKLDNICSPEFKKPDSRVIFVYQKCDNSKIDAQAFRETLDYVAQLIDSGNVAAVSTCGYGGMSQALFKMCVGNEIGFILDGAFDVDCLFEQIYGTFAIELRDNNAQLPNTPKKVGVRNLGITSAEYIFKIKAETLNLFDLQEIWESKLEPVFPYRQTGEQVKCISDDSHLPLTYNGTIAKPCVAIPVFPGTNCEYDTERAFKRAGAKAQTFVINNLSPQAVAQSAQDFAKLISKSQIIMIPGGFSGGDEPDGSAKLITAFFRSPHVTEAVRDLLQNRDGLMLGICNGFQALIKLGLVPYGDIIDTDETCPTLTFNTVGRHQSGLVRTRIASNLSPWLSRCEVGDIHTVAISHGEGRFVASDALLDQMLKAGQIATQYVDENGIPSMDWDVNPNGSVFSIEGITSHDGRIFGKMGHTERSANGLYKNVDGNKYQELFKSGVDYFAS